MVIKGRWMLEVALVTVMILALGARTALLIVYFGPLLYLVFRTFRPSRFEPHVRVSGGRR